MIGMHKIIEFPFTIVPTIYIIKHFPSQHFPSCHILKNIKYQPFYLNDMSETYYFSYCLKLHFNFIHFWQSPEENINFTLKQASFQNVRCYKQKLTEMLPVKKKPVF